MRDCQIQLPAAVGFNDLADHLLAVRAAATMADRFFRGFAQPITPHAVAIARCRR